MKHKILAGVFVLWSAIVFLTTSTIAAEIGFSAAFIAKHSGTVEIFNGQKKTAESAGFPTEIFVLADNIRFGYRKYDQYAKDTYSKNGVSGDGTAYSQTEVLSASFYKEFAKFGSLGPNFTSYGLAGLGLFQSTMVAEAYLDDGSSFISATTQRKTSEMLNLGFLLGAGIKKSIGKAFIGGEVNYVNATLKYGKVSNESDETFDASGLFFSFVAGVSF